jgi:signal transduction histidine kinase
VTVAPEPDLERALASQPGSFDEARGGLGLGLPIARRVFDRHGGRLWSALPDQGVELPLGSRGAIVASLPLSE